MFEKRIKDGKDFILFGWAILECKYAYYKQNRSLISDNKYDILEKEYEDIGKRLRLPLSASQVGIDEYRGSVKLVAENFERGGSLCIDKVCKMKNWIKNKEEVEW